MIPYFHRHVARKDGKQTNRRFYLGYAQSLGFYVAVVLHNTKSRNAMLQSLFDDTTISERIHKTDIHKNGGLGR